MTSWHVPGDVLTRFADDPAALDDVTASSVEAHLTRCGPCRAAVAAGADPAALERSWASVVEVVDRPRRGVVERLVGYVVPDGTARLVAATPGLQVSWLAAVAAMIAAAVAASRSTGSPGPFLALAPLVPLAGVAAAFWPGAEPGGEAGLAAPMATAGLLLRRVQAVVVASMLVLGAGAVALPHLDATAVAWLVPALLVTCGALAASTWVPPQWAVGLSASGWVTTLVLAWRGLRGAPLAESALFAASGQMAMAAAAAVAVAVTFARRRHFAPLEVR